MKNSSDAYWDELGVAWCAIDPNVTVVASRLESRLCRQSRWIAAGLVIGLPLSVTGVLLGVATMGIGLSSGAWNFVTRGIAIVAISAMLACALWSLRSVSAAGNSSTLSQMIDLALGRAQRTLSLIRVGLYSCVIASVFGLVGAAIRMQFGGPPRMSPVIDLAIVALVALVLVLCRRQFRVELGQYQALRRALAVDGDE